MNKQQIAQINALPKWQRKVFGLFLTGQKYTVADISIAYHLSDPRHYIRALRKKGFPINDEWRETVDGSRYKAYYLNPNFISNG